MIPTLLYTRVATLALVTFGAGEFRVRNVGFFLVFWFFFKLGETLLCLFIEEKEPVES